MERRTHCETTLTSTLWCFSLESSVDVYNSLHHSTMNTPPHFLRSSKHRSMNGFRVWSYHIEVLNDGKLTNSEDKTELGYYLNTIATRSVILYWHPSTSKQIGYCTLVRFNERSTIAPNGLFS